MSVNEIESPLEMAESSRLPKSFRQVQIATMHFKRSEGRNNSG
jgi:hypothetical protein